MSWLRKRATEAMLASLPCYCIDAYKDRGLIAPDCPRCQHDEEVVAAIEAVAREFAERAIARMLFTDHKQVFCAYPGRPKEMDTFPLPLLHCLSNEDAARAVRQMVNDAIAEAEKP